MDTEYILDCAFELGETTSLENAVLGHPDGAYLAVRKLVDENLNMPADFLANTVEDFMHKAAPHERYYFALQGLHGLRFGLESFAGRAAHLIHGKVREDLGWDDRPPLRGLYAEQDTQVGCRLVARESDITEGLVRMMLDRMCTPQAQRWARDLRLMADALHWYAEDDGRAFSAMLRNGMGKSVPILGLDLQRAAQAAHEQRLRLQRQATRTLQGRAKAAIKKATKLFQNLGQQQNLQLFVSGAEVTLSHPASPLKFCLKPLEVQGWLLDRTMVGRSHTPYELSVYTKDDVYLARLCVYFADTPVLDQLLALTLYVQSGDELRILEKANWFGMEGWSEAKQQLVLNAYPSLLNKLPRQLAPGERASQCVIDPVFARQELQWEPYRGRVEQWVATWMSPAKRVADQLGPLVEVVCQQLADARDARQALLQSQDMRAQCHRNLLPQAA